MGGGHAAAAAGGSKCGPSLAAACSCLLPPAAQCCLLPHASLSFTRPSIHTPPAAPLRAGVPLAARRPPQPPDWRAGGGAQVRQHPRLCGVCQAGKHLHVPLFPLCHRHFIAPGTVGDALLPLRARCCRLGLWAACCCWAAAWHSGAALCTPNRRKPSTAKRSGSCPGLLAHLCGVWHAGAQECGVAGRHPHKARLQAGDWRHWCALGMVHWHAKTWGWFARMQLNAGCWSSVWCVWARPTWS